MWTNMRLKPPRGPSHGVPHLCELYLLKLCQILTVNTREKLLDSSGSGRGSNHSETGQSILFLTRPVKRNYFNRA